MEQKFMSTQNTYHVNLKHISCQRNHEYDIMFTNYISCQRGHEYDIWFTWYAIYEHVDMIWIMCPDVLFHVWMIRIMLTYLSCTRSCLQILYRGWSYREYMMDIMETWLMSTISSIHILYHADGTLNLSHVTHIMHTWYRDIMCRYEDISCVMCRYEGRAELCVCVCVQHNLRPMLVSLQLFKDTTWCHWHMITFLGRKVIQMEKSWVSGRPAVGIPALLGLGWDTSFRLPWLG